MPRSKDISYAVVNDIRPRRVIIIHNSDSGAGRRLPGRRLCVVEDMAREEVSRSSVVAADRSDKLSSTLQSAGM